MLILLSLVGSLLAYKLGATNPTIATTSRRYTCQFILCVHNTEELAWYRSSHNSDGAQNRGALVAWNHCFGRKSVYYDYIPDADDPDQCGNGAHGLTFVASGCDQECSTFTDPSWNLQQSPFGMGWSVPYSKEVKGRSIGF